MKNATRDKKSLGDRMKSYENSFKQILPPRMPVIIRLDGKAFHTFTRRFKKPYDESLMGLMDKTAKYVCENIQGAQIAYVQSDEITILIHGYKTIDSEPWFANEIQKMVSISSALASSYFTYALGLQHFNNYIRDVIPVQFDSRVFVMPEHDVVNNFIWRQQDWERNSIQMFGLSYFLQKELHGISCKKIIEKCEQERNVKWSDLPAHIKRGRCIYKKDIRWIIDREIPIFKDDRNFIEQHLKTEDE